MKNAAQIIIGIFFYFLFSSCTKETVLTIKGTGFDYNAVFSIYAPVNAAKPLLVKSLKTEPKVYKFRVNNSGYGRLELNTKINFSFWIYLDNEALEIAFDKKNPMNYPVVNTTSKEGKEIQNYYQIQSKMTKSLNDSLSIARDVLDNSTPETIIDAANNYNHLRELKDRQQLEVIREFSRSNPSSLFTLKMINEDYDLGKNGNEYLNLINGLPAEVKDSEEGKMIIEKIATTGRREVGAMMATVAGNDPYGKPYNPKILKNVNLFICWLSYNNESRLNNIKLVKLYEQYKNRDVQFIGVSLDKTRKWWTTVINDDQLIWPQYCDLLHAKSPNLGGLSPQRLPYMFITDQAGTILSQDVGINGIALDLETYLQSHSTQAK